MQYVASKFCAHCFLPLFERGFTETFMMTLVDCALDNSCGILFYLHRVRDKSNEVYHHATDPQDIIRYSTFLAELFFRIRTKVITIIGMHKACVNVCVIFNRKIIHCGHLVPCLLNLFKNC